MVVGDIVRFHLEVVEIRPDGALVMRSLATGVEIVMPSATAGHLLSELTSAINPPDESS